MANYWKKESDFEDDLWALSDCEPPKNIRDAKPLTASPTMVKARSKKSIYEDEVEPEESADFRPVRGRNLCKDLKRPGGTPSFFKQMKDTTASIREVSGLGFSNELIEQQLQTHNLMEDSEAPKLEMPNLGFKPVQSNSAPSSTNVPPLNPWSNQRGVQHKAFNKNKRTQAKPEFMPNPLWSGLTKSAQTVDITSVEQFPALR